MGSLRKNNQMTDTTATPEGAPVTVEAGLANVLATLAAEETATVETPETVEEVAETPDAETGDSDAEPETQDGEEAEVEADSAEEALPATVKVRVNGAELEVPLDEALKGYSRTEDYKAKTAALAEERRSLESQFSEALRGIAAQVQSFDPVLMEAANTDWAQLAKDDPAEYVARQEAVKQRQEWLSAAQAEVSRIEQEQLNETIRVETDALRLAIPALSEPATAQRFLTDLTGYLKSSDMKFDDVTINSVTDHRFYLLAEKARQWDALQSAKATLPAKQVAPKPVAKSLKPSAPVAAPIRKPGPGASEKDRLAWVISRI